MKRINFLITLLALLMVLPSMAQDKIQLMNGKVLRGKLGAETEDYFKFDYYKKGGKVKSMELVKYRIFSHTNSAGEETILYKRDTLMGNFYSKNEMKMFVFGERDAYNNYKSNGWLVTGIGLGFTSVLMDTYDFEPNGGFFKRTPSIFPIAVPLVVTIGAGVIKPKVRKEFAADVSFLSSEYYIEGFQKIAKVKKLKSALLGSVIGVGSGFLVYALAK
ncbi:hypothetical protein [Parvicella tangerina]|uniref:DUF3592 domain-containing protein n=1 Tax=Parvicella tangerina TaxID=2829795 RepID=A0A916NQB2_9FLAO|nr:hypothetical protein [Parvicella tangerina]CAG5078667.1 hypothetical protein CRYO30217_00735 [Parvicella tangerina]